MIEQLITKNIPKLQSSQLVFHTENGYCTAQPAVQARRIFLKATHPFRTSPTDTPTYILLSGNNTNNRNIELTKLRRIVSKVLDTSASHGLKNQADTRPRVPTPHTENVQLNSSRKRRDEHAPFMSNW